MIISKSQIILYSIFGVVAILVIILLFGIFRSLRSNQFTHEEVIKAKDQTIEAIIKGREKDSLLILEKDKNISRLLEVDSIRSAQYLQSQKVYNKINEKLRSIPAYVDRIGNNDDSLRAAYAKFR
jgi:hypothetical protein